MPKQQQWGIIGAGCVGHMLAVQLSKLNTLNLTLYSRKQQAPYSLRLPSGQFCEVPTHTVKPTSTACDMIVLSTKQYGLKEALTQARPLITPETHIILTQNGLGNTAIAQSLYPNPILTLLLTAGIKRVNTAHFEQSNIGQTFLGTDVKHLPPESDLICDTLNQAGLNCTWVDEINAQRWIKLAINCAVNIPSTVYRCNNGALLEHPERLNQMRMICEEIENLMQAQNLTLPAQPLFEIAKDAAAKAGQNRSSTLQDIEAGKPTEIEAITGAALKIAREFGISCPTNQMIYEQFIRSTT